MTRKQSNRAAFLAGYNARIDEQTKSELLAVDVLHAVQAWAGQDDEGIDTGREFVMEALDSIRARVEQRVGDDA